MKPLDERLAEKYACTCGKCECGMTGGASDFVKAAVREAVEECAKVVGNDGGDNSNYFAERIRALLGSPAEGSK